MDEREEKIELMKRAILRMDNERVTTTADYGTPEGHSISEWMRKMAEIAAMEAEGIPKRFDVTVNTALDGS